MKSVGINRTAAEIMDDMQHLHYVLSMKRGARKPDRRLEMPSKTQDEVLSVFGRYDDEGGGSYSRS